MNSFTKNILLSFLLITSFSNLLAQTTVSGTITNGHTQKPLVGVHIAVVGTVQGTTTDTNGKYQIVIDKAPPFTLTFSYVGFHTEEVEINEDSNLDIIMLEEVLLGQEIVLYASRLKQRILLSPVSIEKMDIRFIKQAPSFDFYDALSNLKGVQVTKTSLNFTSVNTRGFADVVNSRFVQIVDGMDTADPTINANLGSIHALSELDIESLELLPGAASALYGANAFNGMMIMTSKSPFDYQGLSFMTKVGFTDSNAGSSHPLGVYSLRYAKAYNNRFAFKVNLFYLGAQDWVANDYKTDRNNPHSATDLSNDPNFDGLNLHGDETPIPVNAYGIGTIRRTGIKESILLDHNDARTRKADAALHYRINDNLELIGVYRYAGGSSMGQEYTKFAYRDFAEEFFKLELKSDKFFVRSYLSLTSIDKTFDVGALGALVNERFNPSMRADGTGWIQDYVLATLGVIPGINPNDPSAARTYADRFMIDPVTGQYTPSFHEVVSDIRTFEYQGNPPGASMYSKSRVSHSEFYYNFKEFDWAEIIAGGSFRQYNLFSDATIFDEAPVDPSDPQRTITNVVAAYTQVSKTLAEKLKLTGSIRFDKMNDFKEHFSPRISAVFSPDKNNNLRVNYQTGFRFPDMVQQFVYFPTPSGIRLGGTATVGERYGVYNGGSYTTDSYFSFIGQGGVLDPDSGAIVANPGNVTLETSDVPFLKPEELTSFEIGFNSIIDGKLLIDVNYYHTNYTNFMGTRSVVSKASTTHQGQQINAGSLWALAANSTAKIKSDGFGFGLTYNFPNNFVLTGNYTYATYSGEQPSGFLTQFNTPRNRINLGLGNRILTDKLGFNIDFSYQDSFMWESLYGVADMPSYTLLNAQINYKLPTLKTIVKVGGSNIGGKDYRTSFGSSFIGQTFYVSLVFDELL